MERTIKKKSGTLGWKFTEEEERRMRKNIILAIIYMAGYGKGSTPRTNRI